MYILCYGTKTINFRKKENSIEKNMEMYMNLIIKYQIEPTDFINIRNNLKWNHIPNDLFQRALERTMINISVFVQDKCVGVGRIIGELFQL